LKGTQKLWVEGVSLVQGKEFTKSTVASNFFIAAMTAGSNALM
jgi:hypothetical protein